ncbi:hypothetical protein OK016_19445 [Vibrio chagasii]|nr:hypothetical protein [Vibrio chagasii]
MVQRSLSLDGGLPLAEPRRFQQVDIRRRRYGFQDYHRCNGRQLRELG